MPAVLALSGRLNLAKSFHATGVWICQLRREKIYCFLQMVMKYGSQENLKNPSLWQLWIFMVHLLFRTYLPTKFKTARKWTQQMYFVRSWSRLNQSECLWFRHCLFVGQSPHHSDQMSQESQVSWNALFLVFSPMYLCHYICLCDCIHHCLFVRQFKSPHHSDQMSQGSQSPWNAPW